MDGDGRSWFEQLSMACGGQCRLPVLTPNLLQTSLCRDLQVEELFKATGHIPCSLRHGLNFSAFWKGIEQNFGGLLLSSFYLLDLSFRIWKSRLFDVQFCWPFDITGRDETRLAFGESCSGLRDSCKIWGVRIWTWRSDLSWRQSFGRYLSGKAASLCSDLTWRQNATSNQKNQLLSHISVPSTASAQNSAFTLDQGQKWFARVSVRLRGRRCQSKAQRYPFWIPGS